MAETVIMPKLGFDMAEGTLVRWVIQEGEPVIKGAVLAEIETDKATVEVESSFSGIVAQHLVQSGDIVPVNTPIATIAAVGEVIEKAVISKPSEQAPKEKAETVISEAEPIKAKPETGMLDKPVPGSVRASPLARRMARTIGIDLSRVKGSGPLGRVTKRDIKEFMMSPAKTAEHPTGIAVEPIKTTPSALSTRTQSKPLPLLSPLPTIAPTKDKTVSLNRLRTAIGRRMTEAKQQVPHFYVSHEYDMEALLDLRKEVNEFLPDEEKISVNDFIIKAIALTLQQYPNLNASLKDNQIVLHGAINIGVAVAVDGGLLTVVCREADRKPLRQIAIEVRSMANRAREGKVRPDDIEGSTFSISNLGMFDVENFTAIINPPEAAILAVGSARQVPVIRNDQVAPGWRMKATISVDHRISDGAEAARFMQQLAAYLEQPLRIIL